MSKSTECSTLIAIAKKNSEKDGWKIRYPFTASKAYWSILKFLRQKKTPQYSTFESKWLCVFRLYNKSYNNLFNNVFASQYPPVVHSSTKLLLQNTETNKWYWKKKDDILPVIKSLNPNKVYGWDNTSIRMIKLCVKPLKYLFESSLTAGIFPEDWKNIIPVHKKRKRITKRIIDQ